MNFRSPIWAIAAGVCAAGLATSARGQLTDLEPLRTIVTRADGCTLQPECTSHVCLRVVIKNNGPATYGGAFKPGDRSRIASDLLRVTVDIDEPGKPGIGELPEVRATFTQDFSVTILPMDSVTVDFGVVGFIPAGGTHKAVATVQALPPYIDPNAANNEKTTIFSAGCDLPATGRLGLAAAIAALAGLATWQLRRRRRMVTGH